MLQATVGVDRCASESLLRWHTGQSGDLPDSPVRQPRHPTVRVLTVSTVGALTSWGIGSPVLHRTGTVYCPVRLLALL
jgi:hypothetical protein